MGSPCARSPARCLDGYAVDRLLRNDLGLLWLVTLEVDGPLRVEGVPLRLEVAHTRRASDVEAALLLALLKRCAAVGSTVRRWGRAARLSTRGERSKRPVRIGQRGIAETA